MARRRTITVHRPADRHGDPHERDFSDTYLAEVDVLPLAAAISSALEQLDLAEYEGRVLITADWPHE